MALFRVLPLTCFMSPHWYFDPQKWVPTFWQNLSNIGVFQFCVHFWKPFSRWEGPFCSKGAHFWTPFFGPFLIFMAALLIFGVLIFDPLFDHLLIHLFSWFWWLHDQLFISSLFMTCVSHSVIHIVTRFRTPFWNTTFGLLEFWSNKWSHFDSIYLTFNLMTCVSHSVIQLWHAFGPLFVTLHLVYWSLTK